MSVPFYNEDNSNLKANLNGLARFNNNVSTSGTGRRNTNYVSSQAINGMPEEAISANMPTGNHNSSFVMYNQFDNNFDQMPNFNRNSPFFMMDQKMSQLSLAGSDLNGNDHSTNNISPPNMHQHQLTVADNGIPQLDVLSNSVNFDNSALAMNYPSNGTNMWSVDFVVNNLRNKFSALKQLQNEFQANYRDGQAQYQIFAINCRTQLNVILQELYEELEELFRSRLIELGQQQAQIEEIMCRMEQKDQKFTNSLDNNENNGDDVSCSFVNKFDPEFVNFVKNTLDRSIPASDIRLQNIDFSMIYRPLRSLLVSLIRQPSSVLQFGTSPTSVQPGAPYVPPMTMASSSSIIQHPSSNNENDKFSAENPSHYLNNSNSNFAPIAPVPFANWGPNMANGSEVYPPMMDHNRTNFNGTANGNGNSVNMGSGFYFANQLNSGDDSSAVPSNQFYKNVHFSTNHNNNGQSYSNNEVNNMLHKQAITKSLQPKRRRDRITYYLKFGEQGTLDGQFAEPSGVAVNAANDDIFIADANNHRIQVFDKSGKFKFHFGEGKLKFPNRVAISMNTGEIVVSERPPVHQIQVYNKNGEFLCKFGSKHLRHPRGLTVDHKNRVIVVECKVMRVFIFNLRGDLLQSFDCSPQIQFPNAVAVSKNEEIFISDNRNHCVKVFTFSGEFLRQIGSLGVTNYPIGVCLNEAAGQLLVVDNYNNLNVTVFRLDGHLIGAYESSVKHQQCLDVALFADNSIVVTSKDLQVYVYRLKDCSNGTGSSSVGNGNNNRNRTNYNSHHSSNGANKNHH